MLPSVVRICELNSLLFGEGLRDAGEVGVVGGGGGGSGER